MADSVVLRSSKNALGLRVSKATIALRASQNLVTQFDPLGQIDIQWVFVSPTQIIPYVGS